MFGLYSLSNFVLLRFDFIQERLRFLQTIGELIDEMTFLMTYITEIWDSLV